MKINDLFEKEIISIKDGSRLGEISDFEINELTGEIVSLNIYGRLRLFGILGRTESCTIPWGCVRVIGEETILVDIEISIERKKHRRGAFIKSLID